MEPAEKTKLLERTLDGLEGQVVLVEGKHDVRALQETGVSARVRTATGKPQRLVEKLGGGPVFLLFDFDEEGERRARVFHELLEAAGTRADTLARKRLRMLLGLRTIEELPTKLREFRERTQNKRI